VIKSIDVNFISFLSIPGMKLTRRFLGGSNFLGWKFGFIAVDFSGFLNLQLQRSIVYDTQ